MLAKYTELVSTCYAVECSKCGKTTWKGCGQHIDRVMEGVAESDRCVCPR